MGSFLVEQSPNPSDDAASAVRQTPRCILSQEEEGTAANVLCTLYAGATLMMSCGVPDFGEHTSTG